jgi:hypothetical protein
MARSILLALVLTACTHSNQISTPGGGRGYEIDCPRIGACYERAGEMCSRGYSVVDSRERWLNATGTATRIEMVVACK